MAAPKLPADFTDLATAYKTPPGTLVNVIGYVVYYWPPKIAQKTGQHQMLFGMQDRSLLDSALRVTALDAKFFVRAEDQLPNITGTGDIVLLRSIKVNPRSWGGRPSLLSSQDTVAIVFPGNTIPDPSWSLRYQQGNEDVPHRATSHHVSSMRKPSVAEQMYAIKLNDAIKPSDLEKFDFPSTSVAPPRPAPAPPAAPAAFSLPKRPAVDQPGQPIAKKQRQESTLGPKFRTISELQDYKFSDLCVEIIDKYDVYGDVEIKVTDYTENKQLHYFEDPDGNLSDKAGKEGDEYGYSDAQRTKRFRGPFGQLVLSVVLKNPHAAFVNSKVNVGDIVMLKNVKISVWGNNPVMSGDIWYDTKFPDKVLVEILRPSYAPEVEALLERKRKYWEARAPKAEPPPNAPKGPKNKKSKKGKRAQQRREAAEMQETVDSMSIDSALAPNKYMRCSNLDQKISSIAKILDIDGRDEGEDADMPVLYHNLKYRAKVRVVDFFPNIEEFAVSADTQEPHDQSQYYDQLLRDEPTQSATGNYRWQFSLLLEDASASNQKEQMWVNVGHEDAQFLLGNDVGDAADLRESARLLSQLKAQMYVLWGDLQEIKSAGNEDQGPSNRPFECCIAEYGVQGEEEDGEHGVVRMYKMFGATVL
ncbi:hypothetical protein MBLNU230_g0024t1 [Neophaeotheca triangularis]